MTDIAAMVDAKLSIPLTMPQWQTVMSLLVAAPYVAAKDIVAAIQAHIHANIERERAATAEAQQLRNALGELNTRYTTLQTHTDFQLRALRSDLERAEQRAEKLRAAAPPKPKAKRGRPREATPATEAIQ